MFFGIRESVGRLGMDPKAAAKSKRSQSLQGKKNHPTPSALSARSQQKKKEPLPQQKPPPNQGERRLRRDLRALPSNWDRYEGDGIEVELEGVTLPPSPAPGSSSGDKEIIAKKSKGTDFGRLIADARSRSRERPSGDGVNPLTSDYLFDESIPALSSLVSIRGGSLRSWCSNDNYSVDINAGSNFEVSFLSPDLNALSAQISKVSLAERLFIEEDFLPTVPVVSLFTSSPEESPEKVDRGKKSSETRIVSQPLDQRSDLAGVYVDELPADIDFLVTGPSTAQPMDYGATLPSLDESIDDLSGESQPPSCPLTPLPEESAEKVDRATKSTETIIENQPFNHYPVLAESSIDELLADVDFLVTGPSMARPVDYGPTLSSLDESIDDLLAETSSADGLERRGFERKPRGRFYEQ